MWGTVSSRTAAEMSRRPTLPAGMRAQATLLATVVVMGALLIAATILVLLTRANLTRSLETVLISRTEDIASLVSSGGLQPVISPVRGTSAQVVDQSGRVVATTPDIEGQNAITDVVVPVGEIQLSEIATLDRHDQQDQGEHVDDEGPYLVSVGGAAFDGDSFQIIVVGSLAPVRGAVKTLEPMLAIGIPMLVLVVAWMTWVLVGRSLRPVEDMITQAESITLARLDRRVPIPDSDDEIHHLAETLNRMLDRLQSSVARQRRFVSDASHELKSPVASLLTMAEVAAGSPTELDMAEFADDVAGEARRLALLVDDLLTLSRSDEERFEFERSPCDLADILREEVASMSVRGVSFDASGLTSATATVDRRRIAQVARNLLDNAARHADRTVWVESGRSDASVWFLVADDGPGISPNRREEIFGRFVRLDDARARAEGGTGLGLAVVKAIVEAHGGHVHVVDDDRFPGAVLRVDLPTGGSPDRP